MNNYLTILSKSIWAGILIGLAGMGFLSNSTIGIFLFAFGLSAIILYKAKLFTGVSGFINDKQDLKELPFVLLGNIIGCYLMSCITMMNSTEIIENTISILEKRLNNGPFINGILGIGCGILMTTAVNFAKKYDNIIYWTPLFLGVPLFIVCGFPHCIADAFYYLSCPHYILIEYSGIILLNYLCIVIGNFIGCNLYRLFIINQNKRIICHNCNRKQ